MSTNARTVSDMINRYTSEYLPRYNVKCQKDKITHLNWWEREIGKYLLSQAKPSLFIKYRNKLLLEKNRQGKTRSNKTMNNYVITISSVFSIAAREWEWMDSSPLRNISKLEEPSGRTRFLSEEELHRLLSACKLATDNNLYLAVVLSLSTCARKSEIMSLLWSDVNLIQGILIFRETKNGTNRAAPLQGHALSIMKKKFKHKKSDLSELIFPSRLNRNKPIDLRYHWEKALRLADIQDFRWHDLRHTGASYLAMSGASLTELSDVLGHKTLQMVKRYAHLSLPHTIKIVAKMNRKMFNSN